MSEFLATKRVGSVLRSDEPLSWSQASEVLAVLDGHAGREIDDELLKLALEAFAGGAERVPAKANTGSELQSHLARGQVYHSNRVSVRHGPFDVLLSLSFTVCVRLDVPFLGRPARTSQSKFWCSAIISGDLPRDQVARDDDFAATCDKIGEFASVVLENVRPIYGRTVRAVAPTIGDINATGDRFSTVLFQVDDDGFRKELERIEQGQLTLAQADENSALGTLNKLFSGPHAKAFLHVGRGADAASDPDVSVDTILHRDRLRAGALVIETRRREEHDLAHWRTLGVTSSSEPVRRDRDDDDEIYDLVHSPANVLSAEMAAEIGEQF